ncbi:hypothetical protein [Gordonia sp. VNK21]|uniref:hypothetical protein n=1 Tax=Gordonia sp. VNK21 TaxID=3382483 RepID=UPI0038D3A0D5
MPRTAHRFRTPILLAATAAAALAGGAAGTAGQAHADYVLHTIGAQCYSMNPNIVDLPAYGGATITTDVARPGRFDVSSDSKSIFPFASDTVVKVTQLASGATKTYHRHWVHQFLADGGGYMINDIPARGKVKVTISGTNRGLLTLPAATCSGTVTVPG